MVHEIRLMPPGEVIDHAHFMATLEQQIYQMATDEPGATGYNTDNSAHKTYAAFRRLMRFTL